MTSLELAYGVYKFRPNRKVNPRKRVNYPATDLSKPTPSFKPPQPLREGSKSVEPPHLPHLRSASPDSVYPARKDEIGNAMDREMNKLESLAMRNISARSELLAIQQRLVDISVKARLEARPRKLPPLS
jgi:hypothetical protein